MKLDSIDKEISECNKCLDLVEKFPDVETVYLGINNDIVLIGEAPANNGWRKSHLLWRDVNGRMLPSGVVLQKLFDMLGRQILDTTFLEAIKCYPKERKSLDECGKNCKNYMMKQINVLKPKLIITLGNAPTKMLLNFNYKKFSDVVGNVYEENGYKIIPIYHPSPVSPMSYKGNLPIFMKLRGILDED